MASGIDLGKQVGPLPLGAWVAVVGAGLGVALYTRRQSQGATDPTVVEDTSGVPGVGTGVNGMWTDVTPVPPSDTPTVYTDNDSWGRAAIDRLVADGYQPAQVYSAITKALAGGTGDNALSVSEFAIWARALILLHTPPTPVGVPAPSPTGPPGTTPPPPTPKPTGYKMIWGPVTVTGSYVGMTLGALQDKYARDAAAVGAAKINTIVLADYRRQAAARNAMSTRTVLRNGQKVSIRRAVRA
jgi:hypothetical protein